MVHRAADRGRDDFAVAGRARSDRGASPCRRCQAAPRSSRTARGIRRRPGPSGPGPGTGPAGKPAPSGPGRRPRSPWPAGRGRGRCWRPRRVRAASAGRRWPSSARRVGRRRGHRRWPRRRVVRTGVDAVPPSRCRACSAPNRTRRSPAAGSSSMPWRPAVRYAASTPDAVDQMPDCSRASVATMPGEQIGGGLIVPRVRIEELEGRAAVVTVDPAQHVPHRVLSQRGGVRSGSTAARRRARSNGVRPLRQAVEPRGTDHGVRGHDRRVPRSSRWSAVTIRRVRRRADTRLHRSGRRGTPTLRLSATELSPASRPAWWTSRPPVRPTPKYWG